MTTPLKNEHHAQADEIRLDVKSLGKTRYAEIWKYQRQLVTDRAAGKIADTLLITEHEPVITMGRGTNVENLLVSREKLMELGIDLFEIERGGDITFHGPGQLVAYPIMLLAGRGKDLHRYLRDLEHVVINTLSELGLKGLTKPGLTGVWIGDTKVCAIGVGVAKWVTFHGMALNINTDMKYFQLINPCGITQYPVGSLKEIMGNDLESKRVAPLLINAFVKFFGYNKIYGGESRIPRDC